MKDRGVIFATEKLSDLRIGHVQFGTAEKHADLTRHDDLFAAFVGHDVIDRDVISASNDFDNDLRSDLLGLFRRDHVFKSDLCVIDRKGICQEAVSDDCFKSTVELTDVRSKVRCDVIHDIVGKSDVLVLRIAIRVS